MIDKLINLVAPGIPQIVMTIGTILEKVIPDPAAREKAQFEVLKLASDKESDLFKAYAEIAKAQIAVNQVEAQSSSLFVAGWRPAVGWTCVAGLVCGLILQPTAAWGVGILSVVLGAQLPAPPEMDMDTVTGLLVPLLGIGALRTIEKVKGVLDSNPSRK